ncbi:MAG TPA: ACT domain-containing protein, partial [Plasticicumulans sp.]|nr:ACT domain-containing protein [Plasticicumulans sp.]
GSLADLPQARVQALTKELGVAGFDEILADIGLGTRMAPLIAKRLLPGGESAEDRPRAGQGAPLLIKGTEGTVVSFGKCCRPLPGDAIIGYLTAGRGVVVHRENCRNVADYKKNPEKWIEIEWAESLRSDFPVDVRIDVSSKRGVFASVAAAISAADANIETISTSERDGVTATVNLTLNVRDRVHLAQVIKRLRALPEVLRIARRGQ